MIGYPATEVIHVEVVRMDVLVTIRTNLDLDVNLANIHIIGVTRTRTPHVFGELIGV